MAIALDVADDFTSLTNEAFTSLSGTHICTGSNLYLLVFVAMRVFTTEDVSGITYNGVSMADLGTATNGSTRGRCFGLVAPASGSHTVAVSYSGTTTASVVGCISCTGVDQTGSASSSTVRGGAATTATGTSSTPTQTVTSATGDLVIDGIAVSSLVTISSQGSGQTLDWNDSDAGANIRRGAGSHEAGASSVVMDWTLSGSGAWASVAASLRPAAGGGGFTPVDRRTLHAFGNQPGKRQMRAA